MNDVLAFELRRLSDMLLAKDYDVAMEAIAGILDGLDIHGRPLCEDLRYALIEWVHDHSAVVRQQRQLLRQLIAPPLSVPRKKHAYIRRMKEAVA